MIIRPKLSNKFIPLAFCLFAGLGSGLAYSEDSAASTTTDSAETANEEVDYEARQEEMKEKQQAFMSLIGDSVASAIDDAFAPKEDGYGSGCLDGLMGLDITTTFVDLTSPWPALGQALKDQLIAAACAYVVAEANEQIAEVNAGINAYGEQLGEQTAGLISAGSKTNKDGSFTYTDTAVSIQESDQLKAAQDIYYEAFLEKVMGGNPLHDSAKLDLTNDAYYSEVVETKEALQGTYGKDDITSAAESAECFLMGTCEDE